MQAGSLGQACHRAVAGSSRNCSQLFSPSLYCMSGEGWVGALLGEGMMKTGGLPASKEAAWLGVWGWRGREPCSGPGLEGLASAGIRWETED